MTIECLVHPGFMIGTSTSTLSVQTLGPLAHHWCSWDQVYVAVGPFTLHTDVFVASRQPGWEGDATLGDSESRNGSAHSAHH